MFSLFLHTDVSFSVEAVQSRCIHLWKSLSGGKCTAVFLHCYLHMCFIAFKWKINDICWDVSCGAWPVLECSVTFEQKGLILKSKPAHFFQFALIKVCLKCSSVAHHFFIIFSLLQSTQCIYNQQQCRSVHLNGSHTFFHVHKHLHTLSSLLSHSHTHTCTNAYTGERCRSPWQPCLLCPP